MHRRDLLSVLCLLFALGAPAAAQAQPYPAKPVRIVIPYPAGGPVDAIGRRLAEALQRQTGQPFVIDNRSGASGSIGADAVAKAAPDGYTILFSTSNPFTMTPFLLSKLPYNPQTDLVPVTQALKGGSFIVANPSVPAKNLVELVALAKKDPGRVSFASYGSGSTAHLGFELLQDAAGIELLHVPYKQSAMPDVIAGQVMLGFEPPISALPNIRAGRVKPIAYTGSQRSAALPDVPTLAERYPGLEVFTWLGFWLPAKTPPEIVDRFNREIRAATQSPEMQRLIAEAGLEPMGTTPEETRAIVRREAEAMGKLIKAKNIRID